jgi:diadenosine tetraphosphate (Ap4A) HIT family hydrolase
MQNVTLAKFGYPATRVAEYTHWAVLLRPAQATLGALVLVCKDEARSFSAISAGAFGELQRVTRDIEMALRAFQSFDKINYLMLMMVDPDVHFHVLPRYAALRAFEGVEYRDRGWPGAPELADAPTPDADALERLRATLASHWPTKD